MQPPPPITTRPLQFRIHAQATFNNTLHVSELIISDTFQSNPKSSFCSLDNTKLTINIDTYNMDHIDNTTITLHCIEEERQEIFASIDIPISEYRNIPDIKSIHSRHKEKKQRITVSSINARGRIKYTDAQEQEGTLVPSKWRTGAFSFKIKAEGLPKALKKKKKDTLDQFDPTNKVKKKMSSIQSGIQRNVSKIAKAATPSNKVDPLVNRITKFTLTLKHLQRIQQNPISLEQSTMQLNIDKARVAKERKNLYLVIFLCFLFLFVGSIFYPLVEGWTVLDSLYFGVVTLTTVGYGDMGPTSSGSKLFTTFYVFFGVAIVATTIGILTQVLIDAAELRADLKKRTKRQHQMDDDDSDSSDDENENENGEECISINTVPTSPSLGTRCCKKGKFFFMEFLPGIVVAVIGILVMFFCEEDISMTDAVYWSVVTGTTVGYGDISPSTPYTRAFALVYLFVAIITTGKALGAFGSLLESEDTTADCLLAKKLDGEFLDALDVDGSGDVNEFEYLSAMLVLLEYVEQDDIDRVMKAFHKLDLGGDGLLSIDDLKQNLKGNRIKKRKKDKLMVNSILADGQSFEEMFPDNNGEEKKGMNTVIPKVKRSSSSLFAD